MEQTVELWHLIVPLAAVVIIGGFFLIRVHALKARALHQDRIVEQARQQLRETGVFLSLGLQPDTEKIARIQMALHRKGLYDGEFDGRPTPETIEAIMTEAEEQNVDLEQAAIDLFKTPRYGEVLPESIQEEIILEKAVERMQTADLILRRTGRAA